MAKQNENMSWKRW